MIIKKRAKVMKKHFYLILLFISINIFSQKVEVFTNLNFGLLTNIPLRNFHNELVEDITFDGIETTDNFNLNYGFSVGFKVNSINTSFFYSHKVSGGKTSLADFSGFIRLTNEIKGSTFGGFYEKPIKELGKGNLYLGLKGMVTFSKLSLQNTNSIVNNFTDELYDFKSIDFGTGLMLTYKVLLGPVTIKPFIGVDFYFGGKLKFSEIPDAHLIFKNRVAVKTGWTGINGGLGFGVPIF